LIETNGLRIETEVIQGSSAAGGHDIAGDDAG